ncbi:MAG: hypothetical protein ACPHVJ_06900 [Psychrobacter sp.]
MSHDIEVSKQTPNSLVDELDDWAAKNKGMAYDEDSLVAALNKETGFLVLVPENHLIVTMSNALCRDDDMNGVLTISGKNYESLNNNLHLPCPSDKENEDFWVENSRMPVSEAGRRIIYKTCHRMGITLKDMLSVIGSGGQEWYESSTELLLAQKGIDCSGMDDEAQKQAAIAVIDAIPTLEYEANHNLDGKTLHLYFSRPA